MQNGNMLINKSAVREYLMRRQPEIRPGWRFVQVADMVYDDLNARLRSIIDGSLKRHPSRGKTFKQIM